VSEDGWDRARLIPTSGINGAEEQERRATSALLAVIGADQEFGRAVLRPLGAPVGVIESFVQVWFHLGDRKCFPGGLIRVIHDHEVWTALVEVRTGSATLDVVQLEMLLDVAYEQGFDAVLTINNEIGGDAERDPVVVNSRKLRAIRWQHYSWRELLAEAVTQRERRGVVDQPEEDQDPGWVLQELIRYLEHPRAGAMDFDDLGPSQIVRRVEIASADPGSAVVPEPREPVLDVDLREPSSTVLHTVVIPEPAVRRPPTLPSRREVRLVRQLRVNARGETTARNDAGWYQDPEDAAQLRWWDGVGWSECTYPAQPALA